MMGLASEALLWLAGAVTLVGALGILRFPDFYTRCHAATMVSVGGFTLALAGMALMSPAWIYLVKVFIVAAVNLVTNPTATHALADSAYSLGIRPAGLVRNDLAGGKAGHPGKSATEGRVAK
jgi:multicomponent Na+:H+ antiporter subunit G